MNKSMRVLFLTTSFPRFCKDSCGTFVFRFAKVLSSDMVIEVVCPSYPGAVEYCHIDKIASHRTRYFIPQAMQRLCYENGGILANIRNSWLARVQVPLLLTSMTWKIFRLCRDFDLIHCHWLPMVWVAWLGSRLSLKRIPIVFTNWGSDTRLFPRWLVQGTLNMISGCISTAAETDNHLLQCGYRDFVQIPAPVDEDRFNSSLNKQECRKYLRIPSEKEYIFCFCGRLNYFKDPFTFLHACDALKKKDISFMALIAGDGDLRRQCEQMVAEMNLHDCVKLLGDRDDVEYIYRASDVAVHISPIENTWANSIAEAMFCETPVIMTDVGHTRTTFTDGIDCLLIPPSEPIILAEKLILLASNKELCKEIVLGEKKLLEKHAKNSATIRKKTIDYYDSIVK